MSNNNDYTLTGFIKQCISDNTIDKSIVKELIQHIKKYERQLSDETKQKISESKKGKIWVYHPELKKSRLVDPLSTYSTDGWLLGRYEFSINSDFIPTL